MLSVELLLFSDALTKLIFIIECNGGGFAAAFTVFSQCYSLYSLVDAIFSKSVLICLSLTTARYHLAKHRVQSLGILLIILSYLDYLLSLPSSLA